MKRLLFFLLLYPVLIKAQRTEWDIAFQKSIPDSLTRPIHMPERDYNPHFRYYDTVNYFQKSRVFIVRSDSVYKELFWRYTYTNDSLKKYKKLKTDPWWYNWMEKHHVDSLPVIDFSKDELLMYSACGQCLAYCNHGDDDGPCHRNACSFSEAWFIREKKQSSKAAPGMGKVFLDLYINTGPDSNRKWVVLPDISRSDLRKFFEVGQSSSYKYVVGTDSLYYAIFSKYPKDSLPVFDFTKQELVVGIACPQCGVLQASEKRYGNDHFLYKPSHRNACRYYSVWYVRDKKNIRGSGDLGVE